MQLEKLIDAASAIAGSEYKLAKELGIPQSHIWAWRHGTRTCSAEDRALMADLAGVDPWAEIAEAMTERWAGKPKGDRLRAIFSRRLQSVGNLYVLLAQAINLSKSKNNTAARATHTKAICQTGALA